MDQSAFRSLLSSQGSSASTSARSASTSSSSLLGGGSRKRGRDGLPAASVPDKKSIEQFRPRGQHDGGKKGKAKQEDNGAGGTEEEEKEERDKFRRYGYTDRASMRRAEAAEQEQEARRPRGLDLSLLDPSKRALLGVEDIIDDGPAKEVPLKTDEEVEQELEAAALAIEGSGESTPAEQQDTTKQSQPEEVPQKKQKRSRADMLRDLQAKLAASGPGGTNGTPTPAAEDRAAQSGNGKPAGMKGFKAIVEAPAKKKKKKERPLGPAIMDKVNPENLAGEPGASGRTVAVDMDGAQKTTMGGELDDDDEFDLFPGAGTYEPELDDDEENAKPGAEEGEADEPVATSKEKYFDDQEELIPKFQTYRSPTPPPRQRSQSPSAAAQTTLRRLEGLSGPASGMSAKEMLEYDDWQAKEEKRKLRKLKGKEKREAMEREAEFDTREGTKEAKEKDRLNREVMEYEKYERKKSAKQ